MYRQKLSQPVEDESELVYTKNEKYEYSEDQITSKERNLARTSTTNVIENLEDDPEEEKEEEQ